MSRGSRPDMLLVHGSATDRGTWAIQLATLQGEWRLHAPTRPGSDGVVHSVQAQARRLEEQLSRENVGSFVAIGSSFGAVVALEIARQWPDRVTGLVLIEPPLSPSDSVPAVPAGFGCHFDSVATTKGGEAAAEMFLRVVLGDRVFRKLPAPVRARSLATWRHIRADSVSLGRYRVDYPSLRNLRVPTLLLSGERSSPRYEPTMDALEAALPNAGRTAIANAGHMLHAEAPRIFASAVREFLRTVI